MTQVQQRLARLRSEKAFHTLLEPVPSIEFEGFASHEALPARENLWKALSRIDTVPDARIAETASREAKAEWLEPLLEKLGYAERYYLSVGGLADLPWASIRVLNPSEWLHALWENPSVQDMIVLQEDGRWWLGLSKEEGRQFALLRKSDTEH